MEKMNKKAAWQLENGRICIFKPIKAFFKGKYFVLGFQFVILNLTYGKKSQDIFDNYKHTWGWYRYLIINKIGSL